MFSIADHFQMETVKWFCVRPENNEENKQSSAIGVKCVFCDKKDSIYALNRAAPWIGTPWFAPLSVREPFGFSKFTSASWLGGDLFAEAEVLRMVDC